jgi:hypothetical protein
MSSSRSVQTLWRFAARKLLAPGCQQPTIQLARGFAAEPVRDQFSNDEPAFKGVLIDAAGTLLVPSESSADVYLRYARQYGVTLSEKEVLQRYRRCVWVQCTCNERIGRMRWLLAFHASKSRHLCVVWTTRTWWL